MSELETLIREAAAHASQTLPVNDANTWWDGVEFALYVLRQQP